jgi:hypothetical protein
MAAFAAMVLSAFPRTDASSIIQASVEANAEDWKAALEYDYFERDGEPDRRPVTYEDLMILGSPYQLLVAVNGKPLAPEKKEQEERTMAAAVLKRQRESPEERTQRIDKYERDRYRDHRLLDQMTLALDFKLVGDERLGPREVYVLTARPRPGYEPPNDDAKVLTGMDGKLWIDQKTFQWVKVEAYVIHPVSIEGILARVEPGTRFELEKAPVTEDIWLPSHFAMKSRAKIIFLFTYKTQEDETYYGYHRASDSIR